MQGRICKGKTQAKKEEGHLDLHSTCILENAMCQEKQKSKTFSIDFMLKRGINSRVARTCS
jgi:hypothetical protein